MRIIKHTLNLIFSSAVILITILGAGCIDNEQQHPKIDATPVHCSESLVPGQNMIINETQNNSTICINLNSSLTMKLTDWSRTGRDWFITSTPGLKISDEGTVWYDENGVPTNVPGLGRGIHTWNVSMNASGVQKIKAVLKFQGRELSGLGQMFDLTIVVN